ncbi:AAA family ATPase [Janthinobacterium sp. LM6]|uniref:AAA family ATPase n=1 Tax=Janthinobacterium sp. LM6 TaxID=1938606 RepID=UPI0012372869|nr:AAA family ATPase [Janthinobacterium sp. LM6]
MAVEKKEKKDKSVGMDKVAGKESKLIGISLMGFKSILNKQVSSISPLTIFSGANSSGKSSFTQVLLLLKQTLQCSYDPGTIMLNGPNVRMTSTEQIFSKDLSGKSKRNFTIEFLFSDRSAISVTYGFSLKEPSGLSIKNIRHVNRQGKSSIISLNSKKEKIIDFIGLDNEFHKTIYSKVTDDKTGSIIVKRSRCFFDVEVSFSFDSSDDRRMRFGLSSEIIDKVRECLQNLIHVPGLRGNPERTYTTTAVGDSFPGRFENYVASIILEWQRSNDPNLRRLISDLFDLGLTSGISARKINDTEVELRVSRIKCDVDSQITPDVSIADVGFGVSQALPVLVSLLVAAKGQMVLIEQPELHLHPRAQSKLSEIIARAVKRGVTVVIETHSNILILGIQTLVAANKLTPSDVGLNWFSINDGGITTISKGSLDRLGAFGEWPTDFMETSLYAEDAYLSAIENRLMSE